MGRVGEQETLTADEAAQETRLRTALDTALEGHAGVSLGNLAQLIGFLASMAGFQPFDDRGGISPGGFNTAREADIVPVTAAVLSTTEPQARKALRFLSIGPTDTFPDRSHQPWVFGRARSFQARPLVRHADGETLSWSGMHTYYALDLLASQLTYAALPGVEPDTDLHRAMHAYSTWRGRVFESQVEGLVRSDLRLRARRISKLDGARIAKPDGNPLGDVDVLIGDERSRTLVALEAKASAPSATPSEHARELERFTATGRDLTDMDHHLMRIDFVEARRGAAMRALGLQATNAESWRVRGAIVTQLSSIASHLPRSPIPVMSVPNLRHVDLVDWIGRMP